MFFYTTNKTRQKIVQRVDFTDVWKFWLAKNYFVPKDWALYQISVVRGEQRSKRLHKHTHDVWPYLDIIAKYVVNKMHFNARGRELEWFLKHLLSEEENQCLVTKWVFKSDQQAMSYADDNYKFHDFAWSKDTHGVHVVGKIMCILEVEGFRKNYFLEMFQLSIQKLFCFCFLDIANSCSYIIFFRVEIQKVFLNFR